MICRFSAIPYKLQHDFSQHLMGLKCYKEKWRLRRNEAHLKVMNRKERFTLEDIKTDSSNWECTFSLGMYKLTRGIKLSAQEQIHTYMKLCYVVEVKSQIREENRDYWINGARENVYPFGKNEVGSSSHIIFKTKQNSIKY